MSNRIAMTSRSTVRRRMGFGRRALPWIAVSLVLLVAGWSALWLFARGAAKNEIDTWLAAERVQGRVWTCPRRTIDGFPLTIAVRCDHPTYADGAPGGTMRGELAGVRAVARLYFPTDVGVDLTGPLRLADPATGLSTEVAWSAARVSLRGSVPGDLDRAQVDMRGIEILPRPGAAPTHVGSLDLGLRPLARTTPGTVDVEAVLKAADLRSPEADTTFGSAEPIAAGATAIVTKLAGDGSNMPALLDGWRQAGGQVQIKALAFDKGPFRSDGDGYLALDDEHRLEGRLNTRFWGLDPIAARFGIPLGAVKIGGALSSLLGGRSAKADTAAPADLDLPLTARNGRLSIGPVKTGVALTPLY